MKNNDNGGSKVPNMNVIKGLLAIVFGVMFVVFSYKIILHVVFLIAGSMLVYYGLLVLNLKQVTDYVDRFMTSIKRLFQ